MTNSLGETWRYAYSSGYLTGVRRPGASTDYVTVGYASGVVSTVATSDGTWTYTQPTSTTVTAAGPLSTGYTLVAELFTLPGDADYRRRVASLTDALSQTTSYTYGALGLLTRITRPEGNYNNFTHDGRGNLTETRQVAKSGSGLSDIVTTASYDSSCSNPRTCNQPNSTTDARGNVTSYTYDSTHGGVLTITSPDPDGGGSLVAPQTRNTYASFYAYYKNSGGSIVAAASPVYRLTETSQCATTSSCNGGTDELETTYTYGSNSVANNRLPVTTTSGSGSGSLAATTTFAYDENGDQLTVDGPLSGSGDTTRYWRDSERRLIGFAGPDPDGGGSLAHRAERFAYAPDGQVTTHDRGTVANQSYSSASAFSAAFSLLTRDETAYDSLGRPSRENRIGGSTTYSVTRTTYDAAGRRDVVCRIMNPANFSSGACSGGSGNRILDYGYDAAGQITSIYDGIGTVTNTYSNNGRQLTLVDANSNTSTFVYDGHDRRTRLRFPNTSGGGSSTTDYENYTYDAAGNITQKRLRDGNTITTTFDPLNRPTAIDAPSGTPDLTNVYDNLSRMTSSTDGSQTLSFAYDQLNRLTSQGGPLGTVSYQYDLAGRRTRMTWPDSFYVDYDYNAANDVTQIRENGATSGAGVLATFAYNNVGGRTSLSRASGASATTTYGYDGIFRTTDLDFDLASTANDRTADFTYNAVSQLASRASSNSAFDYAPAALNSELQPQRAQSIHRGRRHELYL